jgi:phosphoenolpyruvate carboxylase
VRLPLLVTGRDRLLAGIRRSRIDLRNPYVDALSAVQVELLGRLRGRTSRRRTRRRSDGHRGHDQRHAAGLQNTG